VFMLYLLREKTWIAMAYDPKMDDAWNQLCRGVETFHKVIGIKPKHKLLDALKEYSDNLRLLRYEEAIERRLGGRPNVFNTDAIALAMAKHFEEKTGSSKWSMISRLLKCAPPSSRVSMEPEKIRQRVVRWRREERLKQRFKPTIKEIAYNFRREYDTWDRKSFCPSWLRPEFRSATADSSLSENWLVSHNP